MRGKDLRNKTIPIRKYIFAGGYLSCNMKKLDILISPTTRCNLRCKYCYVPKNENDKRATDISVSDYDCIYKWIAEYSKLIQTEEIRITWFGGEPLLVGAEYLNKAIELQRKYFTVPTINVVQTNLTILNDNIIKLFIDHFNSSIGVSIDIGTSNRIYSNGKSSAETVEKNIRILQNCGITTGLVCTLAKNDLADANNVYNRFKKLGSDFRINMASAPNRTNPDIFPSRSEYEKFILELFKIYLQDESPAGRFYNFDMMCYLYLKGEKITCVDNSTPEYFIGLEADGRIMSRCRFFKQLGSYKTDSPNSFLSKIKKATPVFTIPTDCVKCRAFQKVCDGSCIGEPTESCNQSRCGYKLETTKTLWDFIFNYMHDNGLEFSSMKEHE